jgi:hypothetical protein
MSSRVAIKACNRSWLRRRRFPLLVAGIGAVAVSSFFAWRTIHAARVHVELQQFIADLDRDEPGWRIEQLEAARATVPDEDNNVRFILKARRSLPRFAGNEYYERMKPMLESLTPNIRLTDEQYRYCIDRLEEIESTVWPMELVARMPRGHCPLDLTPGLNGGHLPLINDARLPQVLPTALLVVVCTHEDDLHTALRMCHANLNIAAAIGDEPILVCQWDRRRHANTALDGLERMLGHHVIPESDLSDFHGPLIAEAVHDTWRVGMAGERAWIQRDLDALSRGAIPMSQMPRKGRDLSVATTWRERVQDWLSDRTPVNVDEYHLWWLRRTTQLLRETAGKPWHERTAAVAAFAADEAAAEPFTSGRHMPRMFHLLCGVEARLRCGIAGIAAERYRVRFGRWPDALADLVPEFLPAVPEDVFSGGPLRYERLADGVRISSVVGHDPTVEESRVGGGSLYPEGR